jgi:hypothetical protein
MKACLGALTRLSSEIIIIIIIYAIEKPYAKFEKTLNAMLGGSAFENRKNLVKKIAKKRQIRELNTG